MHTTCAYAQVAVFFTHTLACICKEILLMLTAHVQNLHTRLKSVCDWQKGTHAWRKQARHGVCKCSRRWFLLSSGDEKLYLLTRFHIPFGADTYPSCNWFDYSRIIWQLFKYLPKVLLSIYLSFDLHLDLLFVSYFVLCFLHRLCWDTTHTSVWILSCICKYTHTYIYCLHIHTYIYVHTYFHVCTENYRE